MNAERAADVLHDPDRLPRRHVLSRHEPAWFINSERHEREVRHSKEQGLAAKGDYRFQLAG